MRQGKICSVGPFLHKGNHKDHGKYGEDHKQNYTACQAAEKISSPVLSYFYGGNLVVPDIVAFQPVKQGNAQHRGEQHRHCHYRSIPEIWHTAKHFVVKNGCHNLKLTSHRRGNPVVSKTQKKALYHGGCESAQKWAHHGSHKGGKRFISHDS